ncbi:MAG: FHA domain-containing protein [Clostridiaceae bacterium]|nr:FHA domain-containing protein [Clostridiaceae bacterium]
MPIYESDDFGSYLIIKPKRENLIEYQVEMISNNCIPGLLAMDLRCKNNEEYLYYKITSRIPLSQLLSRKKINKMQLLDLLNQIIQTMLTGVDYLLYSKCYILDQKFIYVDPAAFKLYMVYVPMEIKEDVNRNLRNFVIDLIVNATYIEDDDPADGCIQKIINYIKGDTFNITGFDRLLKQLNQGNCQENSQKKNNIDKYYSLDTYKTGDEDMTPKSFSSESFLYDGKNENEINQINTNENIDIEDEKGELQTGTKSVFKAHNKIPKENPYTIHNFKLIAIGAATQIILPALFLLSRNFLETLGGNTKTTYAAAILIIMAIDVLVIKNLLDHKKSLKKQGLISKSNTQSKANTQSFAESATSADSSRKKSIVKRFKDTIIVNQVNDTNNTPGKKEKDMDGYMEGIDSIMKDYDMNDFMVNNILERNSPGHGFPASKASNNTWTIDPESANKTVLLSMQKELKPYIVNMAEGLKEEIPIDKKEFLIGRLEDMVDCVIKNSAVGKVHALITERDNKYYLKDLNSVNGTMINDVKLQCNEENEIKDGDRITFANSDYLFVLR